MLTLKIPALELFNEQTNEIIYGKETTLVLEHSLVSISKWESKWEKPFLSKNDKTNEETIDYIKCMTLTQNVDPEVYNRLTDTNIMQVSDYIQAPMTATWFNDKQGGKNNGEVVTSEIIYYWMIALNIPVEFQKWHLNRLLTLIKVCNIKNQPPKKMSKSSILSRNAALNKARRNSMGTKG